MRQVRLAWIASWMLVLYAVAGDRARAEDWPTYRHDAARSGVTSEQVRPPLSECWAFKPRHAPQPAWGDPKPEPVEGILELRRIHFDDAFHVAVAGGAVYFGSSADGKVFCLDASTGRVRWSRITDGPVRLAPTVADGKVFVGSDDGHAYCLDAEDGSLVWKFRAAPEDKRVLGSGKMISLWPLRSGVLVDEGAAYFAAGVFPAEGVFLYAVDADTGREIWRNDTCGEEPQSRVSPQGYLLASKTTLYAPMARVSPAAFDRNSGALKYHTYFGKPVGGTYALLSEGDIFTGTEEMVAYRGESRDRFAAFAGRKLVVTGQTAYVATESHLSALDRKAFPAASLRLYTLRARKAEVDRNLRRQPSEALKAQAAEVTEQVEKAEQALAATTRWKIPSTCRESLILAGGVLFAGGKDRVIAVEAASGKELWSGRVEGTAKGLAAAAGRLLVSTDKGTIYSFGPEGSPHSGPAAEPADANPYGGSPLAAMFEQAAKAILQETGIRRGYCLVLGCQTGQLAFELPRRSELMIYVVEPDAAKVDSARKALDAAGLYGARVCVEPWPLEDVPYSDYFANLIVSETAMVTGSLPPGSAAIPRMLKPLGGTILLGQPSDRAEGVKPLDPSALRGWLDGSGLPGGQVISTGGTWAKLVRGPLPGAGNWTHQYANLANTACGDDQIVKCPLGVLWFGRPGPGKMVNRHSRAAGPLSVDGRLFVQGENVVMAYDAYNGFPLWEREIPGAMRLNASYNCSNLAAGPDGLFVAVGDTCLRLDPASGRTLATYAVPQASQGQKGRWGYVARRGDLLYGSRTPSANEGDCLFAVDVATGKHRWVHNDQRIHHASISIGDGGVFFVSSSVTSRHREQVVEQARKQISEMPEPERAGAEKRLAALDVKRVVALNTGTGQVQWEQPLDLTHCGGGNIASMVNNGVLVVFGVYLDGHYWQQFFDGQFASRRVTALAAEDGKQLWSKAVGYRVRPLIVGDTLHAEPWSFDLHTGQPRMRVHPITGQPDRWQFARPGHHCGCPCASPNCLFFRSYNLGYYDLSGDGGTMHFGAQRPGCWINFIPAGGLVLAPEASAGCMCPFPNMCTVVFQPATENKAWAFYSAPGPLTPVKQLAINLGAPGDRRDAAGNLWLGLPRPSGSLVLQIKIDAAFYPGGGFVQRNSSYTPIAGTDDPWLFTSAAKALRKCTIPLLEPGDGTALYRVRLAFADPDNDQPGKRVFDVKLQRKAVLENFDVAGAAGGRDHALFKEFSGVEVHDNLVVELVPKTANPAPEQAPILQGVEVVRERVVHVGCAVPDFLLSTLAPEQTGQLRLANLREGGFEGTLQVAVPEGFQVAPTQTPVKLASGGRATIPLRITVADDVSAGRYQLNVKLVRADGTVELERDAAIEHLGRRGRIVLRPIEDAHVGKRYPDRNRGSAAALLVDGGNQTMGDADHHVAYLKFRLEVPGKPLSAKVRIHNAGNPTGDSGRICLVTEPWSEKQITYAARPKPGPELARLGRVSERQVVECPLDVDLEGKTELSLLIDPTSCDGVDYLSRESDKPAELTIEYEPGPMTTRAHNAKGRQ